MAMSHKLPFNQENAAKQRYQRHNEFGNRRFRTELLQNVCWFLQRNGKVSVLHFNQENAAKQHYQRHNELGNRKFRTKLLQNVC